MELKTTVGTIVGTKYSMNEIIFENQMVGNVSAQNAVLEDMRDSRGIGRRGAKRDPENLVLIVVNEREQLCPSLGMAVDARLAVDLGDLRPADFLKAMGRRHASPLCLVRSAYVRTRWSNSRGGAGRTLVQLWRPTNE